MKIALMFLLLASTPASAQPSADRIAALEEAGIAAVREINGAVYAIENREDGGPVDDAIVGRLHTASETLYEAVSDGQFVCDDHPKRCEGVAASSGLKGYLLDVCDERDGKARRTCAREARRAVRRCGTPYCLD